MYPRDIPNNLIFNKTLGLTLNTKEENIEVNLVFIGFNSEYILEENVKGYLPTEIDPFALYEADMSIPHSNYNIDYSISYLAEDKTTALEDCIINISEYTQILGHRVNNSAVDEFIINQQYDDILDLFIPCSGYTIDAAQIEDFININIHSDFEGMAHEIPYYTLYLMNFSSIDTEDHSIEHSYVPYYVDCDSNRSTDISLTGTNQRNAIGWGGNYRFCYADLSAISEYLLYYPLLLGIDFTTAPTYYRYDLDSFIEINDIETTSGKEALAIYITDWIDGYVRNVFISSALYTPSIYDSFYLPIKVFNNVATRGYPYETMMWAFSEDKIKDYLSIAFPWIKWRVEYDLDLLTDYTEIYNHLVAHTQNNGVYNYINLQDVVDILDEYNEEFYPSSDDYSQLPSYVLIFYNTYIQHGDIRIGGVAIGRYQIIARLPYLFFEDSDIDKPIMGLTNTLLHELGHNLGLDHPHNDFYGYGSMFIDDVMSYIHCSDQFSTFSSDTIARFHYDYYYMSAEENLNNLDLEYTSVGIPKILKLLEKSRDAYLEMNYITAVGYAMKAWEISTKLDNIIRKPAVFWSVISAGIIGVLVVPIVVFRKTIVSKTKSILGKQMKNK